ncbi:TfoX/Sxy family protein [Microbacterium sp.]|uniref:TfoX/Sxy family protein n=1 Tax=Microbacterium sp. TaxID=51671 RepID=UPI0039E2EC61
MNVKRTELADRIRALLIGENVVQKPMFGSLAFMVDDRLLVAAWGDGDLLVRVDPADSAELLLQPGAHQAEMGAARRSMGPSWLTVDGEALADEERLLFWVDVAQEYHGRQ